MRPPTRGARLLVGALTMVLVLLGAARPASAHPLGNFTINHYARVEVSEGVVRVSYVLDLAEVPAFQARDDVTSDPEQYLADQVASLGDGLTLEVDGRALDLRAVESQLRQPEGQGGLTTLRLSVLYEAALPDTDPDAELDGRFTDENGVGRIGWREVVVTAAGDAEVLASSVPAEDVSDALRSYPEDRLRSPLDVREATFRFTQGSEQVDAAPIDADGGGTRAGDRFTRLLDRQSVTPLVLAGMLGVAALVGVGHALAPGHGKTVMAAYLIGTRGRPIDAVLLGVIVSAMHTTSVLLLGLALYQLDERLALDRIYPVLTLISGIGVLVVGAWLAFSRYRVFARTRPTAEVDQPSEEHATVMAGHGHGHEVTGAAPTWSAAHSQGVPVGAPGQVEHGHGVAEHDHGPDQHAHGPDQHAQGLEHDHRHDQHGRLQEGHEENGQGAHGHGVDEHDPEDHEHAHREHADGHESADGHEHGHGAAHEHEHDEHGHDEHGHDEHGHDEHGPGGGSGHGHSHGPGGHSHDLPEGVAPLSKRGLVLLATAGGIVPSPSAVIVLVSAFTLGRIGLGLALVAAFSVGLAATLTAVGLALVVGSRAIGDRGSAKLVRVFPVVGACALLVLGLVLTVQGARGL